MVMAEESDYKRNIKRCNLSNCYKDEMFYCHTRTPSWTLSKAENKFQLARWGHEVARIYSWNHPSTA